MTTPIKYDVTVGVEEAKRALAQFEDALKKSDNAAARLDVDIGKLEVQAAELSAAIKAGGANAKAYALELHRVTDAIAGAKGLAPATGHAASRMLILGQFVDDAQYGLRGVVNNMPQVVQAFGGAAGLAGGIGIAAVALSQLHDGWKAYDAINKESEKNLSAWRGQAERTGQKIREDLIRPVEDLTKSLRDANDQLDQLKYGDNLDVVRASTDLLSMQTAKIRRDANLERERTQLEAMQAEAKTLRYGGGRIAQEQIATQKEVVASIEKTARVADAAIAQAREKIGDLINVNDAIRAEEERQDAIKKAKDAAEKAAKSADPTGNYRALYDAGRKSLGILSDKEIDAEADRQAKALEENSAKLAEEGMKVLEAADKEKAKREKTYADREELVRRNTLKAFDRFNEEELKLQEAHAKAMAGVTVDAVGAIATAIVGAASGQKDAWADLLTYGAKAAGDLITLEGSKSLGTGIAAVAMGNPAGVGQIATGLGIIAAGQAISIGGAAAVGVLTGATGKGSAASGGRDPGASPRRASGGTGGDGSLVVNVSYGVAGPLPEDTARAIAAAVRTGDRRRGGR